MHVCSLAKHCTRLPADGFSVIRKMLEHFQIFYNFNLSWVYYILCISWIIKCLIIIDARCRHEDDCYFLCVVHELWLELQCDRVSFMYGGGQKD